jgi:hypothetical protein
MTILIRCKFVRPFYFTLSAAPLFYATLCLQSPSIMSLSRSQPTQNKLHMIMMRKTLNMMRESSFRDFHVKKMLILC